MTLQASRGWHWARQLRVGLSGGEFGAIKIEASGRWAIRCVPNLEAIKDASLGRTGKAFLNYNRAWQGSFAFNWISRAILEPIVVTVRGGVSIAISHGSYGSWTDYCGPVEHVRRNMGGCEPAIFVVHPPR